MAEAIYSQSFAEAIAEAERLVREAPFIENEADLLEGLQYLAGGIAACTHIAFDYDRDHPFLQSGTGPFTKMGLDNPDTLYFGTRVQAGREYVVTGKRGTTTDLSFQLLGGEYTDQNVPDSETAFDDRKLSVAADGTFEWRFIPKSNAQLVIREVYNDWSAQRGTVAIARTDTAGSPPPIVGDLLRPTARVCEARGLPLGLTPTASYENRRTALKPGEFLLIYSDALTDLRLENGTGMGWDRLSEVVAEIPRGCRPAATFDRIWDRLRGGVPRPLCDDLTIALFGRAPRQETLR